MKKNKRARVIAGGLAAVLAMMTLVACGGSTTSETAVAEADYSYRYDTAAPMDMDDGTLAGAWEGEVYLEATEAYSTAETSEARPVTNEVDTAGGENFADEDRKIIMSAYVTIEALEYEDATAKIDRVVKENGAYLSYSSVYNSTVGSRSADYTVKVPAENYRALLTALEGAGNMVSRSESSEDVTTQYIDIEARLKSLRAQEERLLELMAEAGDLESLILVQQQLSEVQYQIEYYEGLQRSYDRQVAYSTIQVYLYEVIEYTEPEPEGYLSQIGRSFTNGWKTALSVVQNIGLTLAGSVPFLIVLAIGVVVLVILLRRSKKRRAATLQQIQGQAAVKQGVAPPAADTQAPKDETPGGE